MSTHTPALSTAADADLTLDPADWPAFRALAHRMLDDSLDQLESLPATAPWRPLPEPVRRALLEEPLPRLPQGAADVYRDFLERVQPFTNGNRHPRFWGWMQSNGTPLGMMADMLAAGINAHLAGFDQAPKHVEMQVIRWLAEAVGYAPDASGLLASGGTMANIIGITVARNAKAGFDLRAEGALGQPRMMFYASAETHSWIVKGLELLGMGRASLRSVPVDGDWRVDVSAMRDMIRADRAAGHRPICVIGTAGTINSAAIDDLESLADLAREEALWFHVDGAFGAMAALSPNLRPLLRGMERADSLAFDLHKWGFLPFEVACVLVRDAAAHRDTFAVAPSYLQDEGRGVIAGGLPFADRGPELTRSFKALKVWMSFKAEGVDRIAALIEQNVAQARRFAEEVAQIPGLKVMAPVSLNVACWRAEPAGTDEAQRDRLNRELLLRLQESGLAIPSGSVLGGRYVIRIAIANHRSRWSDFDAVLRALPALLADVRIKLGL